MIRVPRLTFVSEGYPFRRLLITSMKGQLFVLLILFHNIFLVWLRNGGTVKTCTPIASSRIALFSKQARHACPDTIPLLAEGGGIEPLGHIAHPGFQDRLPAIQRHPLP